MRSLAVCFAAAALVSCADRAQFGGDPNLSILPGTELPAPQQADASNSATAYFIGPFDRLLIDVFGIEELSGREVQVDASGRISFPLAGVVEVLGKTPSQVEGDLVQRLKLAHVRDPQVTVNAKEIVSRTVTVEGEVRKPGVYPVVGRMTLMNAVARAESTTEFSRAEEVVVFRTVSGQRYAAIYNLAAIRNGAYADPQIFAGDVVSIGVDTRRRLFRDVLAASPALLSPILILLR